MAVIIPFDQREGSLWYDGVLVPWREAQTHVLTHGLHYASSVFEGERMYGGRIYKLEEHTRRLFESARILDMKIPFSEDEIIHATIAAAEAQHYKDAYVRPVVFRGSEMMSVAAPNSKIHVAIAAWEWASYFHPKEKMKGIRLCMSDWKRPAPDTIPWKSKAAGLYMICTLSKHAAEAKGYHDALMLDYRRTGGGSDRRQRVLRERGQAAHAGARLLPRRHHAAHHHCAGQGAADSRY